MPKDYITILTGTPKYAAAELLYDEYINCHPALKTPQDAAVTGMYPMLDEAVRTHSITDDILGDYEEASKHAGFNAGFRAGAAYICFLMATHQM